MKRKYIILCICIVIIGGIAIFYFLSQSSPHQPKTPVYKKEFKRTPATVSKEKTSFLGEIAAISNNEIRIENYDGESVLLRLSDKTIYIDGKQSDLAVGESISGYGMLKDGEIFVEKLQVTTKSMPGSTKKDE